jgi:cytochrome b
MTVEAEAMPASLMREILREHVEALLPEQALHVAKVAEQSERDQLIHMAEMLSGEQDHG